MKGKDQSMLDIFYMKKSSHLGEMKRTLGSKHKNQTDKLFGMTKSICCFYRCLLTCKK